MISQAVAGAAGAAGYGFFSDGIDSIASISVSSTIDFAVGEFGIAAQSVVGVGPEPLSFAIWTGLLLVTGGSIYHRSRAGGADQSGL
jgi:hypothetical protein